ncbi:hypothetical protein [Weissella confusa]|uniref:hypothetical protein n=1 Tax=Weissella confusa TaxID=1583 RepID=UPI0021A4A06D|nr:hypothetical protein [Weissella confusa]MCT2911652.1 hypothetical protein [Weissella confusa]
MSWKRRIMPIIAVVFLLIFGLLYVLKMSQQTSYTNTVQIEMTVYAKNKKKIDMHNYHFFIEFIKSQKQAFFLKKGDKEQENIRRTIRIEDSGDKVVSSFAVEENNKAALERKTLRLTNAFERYYKKMFGKKNIRFDVRVSNPKRTADVFWLE